MGPTDDAHLKRLRIYTDQLSKIREYRRSPQSVKDRVNTPTIELTDVGDSEESSFEIKILEILSI